MIVKSLEDIIGTEDEAKRETWARRRFILKKDNVSFRFNDTIIKAGTESCLWYKNSYRSSVLNQGEGKSKKQKQGKYGNRPGTMYLLNEHDKHKLWERQKMRMIGVFNPPLVGTKIRIMKKDTILY